MVVKDGTCITLLGLTANAEFTEVHPPLGVAAGRIDKLRAEESPDDLQINHQIRVEAHLVA